MDISATWYNNYYDRVLTINVFKKETTERKMHEEKSYPYPSDTLNS